mgnify:CR=1 FL=1
MAATVLVIRSLRALLLAFNITADRKEMTREATSKWQEILARALRISLLRELFVLMDPIVHVSRE